MSEPIVEPITEPMAPAAPPITPPAAATTPPQAVTVDMEAINKAAEARAERAAQAVVKDMLTKQGLDDEAIKGVLAEWKSKQVTPEQTITQLQNDLAAERSKTTAYQQEKVLRGHGLTDDEDIEIYTLRINKLVTDGKTFEQAAQEYFEVHPRSQKVPASATYGGSGKTPMTKTAESLDDYKKMTSKEKIKLKAENPALYERFKKELGF